MRALITLFITFLTLHSIGQSNKAKNLHSDKITKGNWEILSVNGYNYYSIFHDSFDNQNDDSWNLLNGRTAIENNRLKFHFAQKGRIRATLNFSPMPLNDNEFLIKTIVDKNSNALYEGIVFGFKDHENYSSITFSVKEKMVVYERIENGITTEDDEAHNVYLIDYSDNEVRLVKKNNQIKIFFNGVEGYEVKNKNTLGDLVGLISGGEDGHEAYYKSFYVEIGMQPNAGFENNKANSIKVNENNGVYSVPVELNGVLKIDFIFDSGASDISISPDIALTLLKTGTIKKEDWLPGAYYSFADGSTAKSARFKLNSVKIGNKVVRNAVCSISNSIDAPMLLGQSVLSKFGKYTFDNSQKILTIE